MTTFGLYGARLSLAVWRHFICYIFFVFTYYFVLSLKNKYTILLLLYYKGNWKPVQGVENRVAKAWSKWRELGGVICDKKVPTKLKVLIYQTVIRPTLLYGCETWTISIKYERCVATTEMRMVRWAMGVSLLEHRRNEEILEEAKVEQIATVMRRRRLEWFGHVKRRDETENIRAVVEMKIKSNQIRFILTPHLSKR